jgi:hypothetical protein
MKARQLYIEAGTLAAIAMGNKSADNDPLAWYLLTENIVDLAEKHQKGAKS